MISFYKFLLASLLLPTFLAAEPIKVGVKIEDVRRNLSSLGYQEGENEFLDNVILGQLDDPVGPSSQANHPELWRVGDGYLFILSRIDTRLVTALYFYPAAKEKVQKKIDFQFSVTSFDPVTGQLVIEIGTPEGEQDGTGQPAARPESKSEGGDKPQPEAKGRSR